MQKFYLCQELRKPYYKSRIKTFAIVRTILQLPRCLQLLKKVVSPLPIRQGESYSLAYSKRLASVNWASRLECIIHRTNFLAPSAAPTSIE
jgi:hypothetical protein